MRPTLDRVRESIFGILGPRVNGAAVLDLFSGTGAMGLEAISRGAASAVLVEADAAVCEVLRRNVDSLGAREAEILRMDCRRALRRLDALGHRFQLLFLDPPYGRGIAARAAAELASRGVAEAGATVVVEESARSPLPDMPSEWIVAQDRLYGDTRVLLYEVPR